MNKIELAKWLHDTYEEVAKEQNWNTQENCKVEFDTLPDANKRTMIEVANRLLNFDLLHLPLVSEQLAITALTKIAHPIKYLQDEAIKEGAKLDGCAAIALTHDINFYQDIAIKALREIANSL